MIKNSTTIEYLDVFSSVLDNFCLKNICVPYLLHTGHYQEIMPHIKQNRISFIRETGFITLNGIKWVMSLP